MTRAVTFLLLLVLAPLLAPLPGAHADALLGERVFQRCYACHSVVAGEDKLPGPNLRGVIGRRAGTLPGFEFSPAMVEAGASRGLVWTRATLDAFLADPQRLIPGTAMGMPGLPDDGDRRDVIDYLEQAGKRAPARAPSAPVQTGGPLVWDFLPCMSLSGPRDARRLSRGRGLRARRSPPLPLVPR